MWQDLPTDVRQIVQDADVRVKLTRVDDDPDIFPEEDVIVTGVATRGEEALFVNSTKDQRSWEFPGGRIESGETPDEAVEREVQEETGYTVNHVDPRLVLVWALPERTVTQIVYAVDLAEATDTPDEEVEDVAWREALPETVSYGGDGAKTHEVILEELAETAGRESRLGKVDVFSGNERRVAAGVLAAGVVTAVAKKARAKFR